MRNKFINLSLQELNLDLKAIAVLLLVIFSLFFQKNIRLKKQEIVRLNQDKITAQSLEKQIPALEAKLISLEAQGKRVAALKSKVNLVLKGIFIKDGKSSALINDDIYQKNDTVSGLIITAITSKSVTFEDPATGEQGKIQLPE